MPSYYSNPAKKNTNKIFWGLIIAILIAVIIALLTILIFAILKKISSDIDKVEAPSETFTETVNGVSFTMVMVEGGTFSMGATFEQSGSASEDEYPCHDVTLTDYYIGETEVTQDLWEVVMGTNPSHFRGYNLPVENVSWHDCQVFISRLNNLTNRNYSLPTEAQWEYAARGGNYSRHYKYSGSHDVEAVAWHTYNTNDTGPQPVKSKRANELGLYDMSGNVWEWCSDRYGSYSYSHEVNPTGVSYGSVRVCRGGSWFQYPERCRVSYRSHANPRERFNRGGLRLALKSK